jgi:hypothetical protein
LVHVLVNAEAVVFSAVLSKDLEDFGGEGGFALAKPKIVVDSGQVTKCRGRGGEGGQVEWKGEDASDGSDGTGNVGAIDGTGVPSVCCGLGDAIEEEFGRNGTVGAMDCDGLIKDAKESFDGKGFVVAWGDDVILDVENFTHGFKVALEFAVGVDDDEATEADFEENGAHEEVGERLGGGAGDVFT